VFNDIVEKRFNGEAPSIKEGTQFIENLSKQVIQPLLARNIDEDFRLMNGYKNMMSLTPEVIASNGLITGISKYALRVTNDEGKELYDNPKMKIVGMPNISVTLPIKIKEALNKTLDIFFDKDNDTFIDYIKSYKKEFCSYKPSEICQLMGVTSISKYLEPNFKGTVYWVSKASIIYNNLVLEHNMQEEHDLVTENDKVRLIYLKKNPFTDASVIAFKSDLFLEQIGLDKYINHDVLFDKLFLNTVQAYTETNHWAMNDNNLFMDLF